MGTLPEMDGVQLGGGAEDRIRDYLQEVSDLSVSDGFGAHYSQYRDGLNRLSHLESVASSIAVTESSSESEILTSGLSALSLGLTRCLMCTEVCRSESVGIPMSTITWLKTKPSKTLRRLTLMAMLASTSAPGGGVPSGQGHDFGAVRNGSFPLVECRRRKRPLAIYECDGRWSPSAESGLRGVG